MTETASRNHNYIVILRNKNNNLVSTFIFLKGGQTAFSSNVLYYFRIGVQGKLKMVNITDKHSLNVYHVGLHDIPVLR